MKKRIIALMISAILCVSLLPYEVFANLQSPVEMISETAFIGHTDASGVMNPEVELQFTAPIVSGREDTQAVNGIGPHEASHYQIHFNEYSKPSEVMKAPLEPSAEITPNAGVPVHKHTDKLKNGMLYKMSIIPYHRHPEQSRDNDGMAQPGWANHTVSPSLHPFKYVLTDFDTKVEGKNNSLEVTWENSGYEGMQYKIGYVQGNHEGKSIAEIESIGVGNNIHYIGSADIATNAKKGVDSKKGNTLTYTITDQIAAGQMYSVFVISTTQSMPGSTDKILKNDTHPKVVTATTEIGLEVFNIGKDKIRLEWNPQLIHLMDGEYKLEQTQIIEYGVGQTSGRPIATLYGKEGADIGYYEYREPQGSTYYQLVFTYKLGSKMLTPQPKTAKILYVPGELRTKPATPEIPKAIGPNSKVTAENKGDFLVPGDLLPDIPNVDLWKNNHTFHANMVKPPNLNFVWSAYKEDLSLLYDIWVTDDIGIATAEVDPIVKDLSFASGQNAQDILYNKDKEEVVGFKHILREYYNSDMKKLPLIPNKVYYVKIVAKKQYGDELEPSLPVIVTIMFNSDGEVFAPPTISKPPLILDPSNIGTTSITIGWLETWYEIMAKNPMSFPIDERKKASEWNAKVYTTTEAAISFVHKEGSTEHVLKREQNIGILKNIVGGSVNYAANYIDRVVNLGKNVQYDYKFIPYQEVLKGLESHNVTSNNKKSVEEYIEMLMKDESDPEQGYGWKNIMPTTKEDEDYLQWKQHTQNNLKPNTSYVFFVRPYSYDYDGTKLQASLPTWIIGTTLPDGEMPEGKPTVPVLSLNSKGDTHISVEWEYNSAFNYEIVYSRLEDPDKATAWPFKISTDIGDPTYVEHGGKAVVTIDGLFPETTYNVWIRAKQKKGSQISAWSNPVTTKTDLLGAPTSPAGLGVASYQSILEVGKDFKPVDSNHITVEWQRNAPDKDLDNVTQDNKRVQKEYRYVIEIADNPEFIDKQAVTVSKETVGSKVDNAEILSRSMVYFGELIANRPYYIRAKTVLIAHDQENDREIIKESAYTQFIRIITKPSQDEYDGGDKVNEVIYPKKIEETYDGTTWTYTILDTQKVINEMVTGNQFKYVVPVQKYRGTRDAKFRVIRIPQPVVTTLLKRRMELEIRTNILTIQIPAKALESHMVGTSADGMVEFIFETLSSEDLYGVGMGYEYGFLSQPEKMSITVKGPKGVASLNKIDALLKININMPNQVDYMDRNLGGYTYDTLEGIWTKGNHQFDKINMQLGYTSGSIGTYAVYEKTRVATWNESMTQSMTNIVKKYDVVGLGTRYTPSTSVSTSEYINIMLGIAEKKSQIKPDKGLTAEEIYRAKNAGIYIGQTSTALTQEAAISGVVRVYELTNGISVRPQTKENVSAITTNYRSNIQKAYTIGLISGINAKQPITYAELFNLIEQVIE
ncbi:MAG TPA: fibronectin type III domain-containing protein [Epulopiscium sp.]|nr:fibronectin type III domain-containing protein [Candidatus Epulonipiscium sp.]